MTVKMEWFKILCQFIIIVSSYEFCQAGEVEHSTSCLYLKNLTIDSDKDIYNMKNAKNMEFCKVDGMMRNGYRIRNLESSTSTAGGGMSFGYRLIDNVSVEKESLVHFNLQAEDFKADVDCEFETPGGVRQFLKDIHSIADTYLLDQAIEYFPGSNNRNELAKPAVLYVKQILLTDSDENYNTKTLDISSTFENGNQTSYLTVKSKNFALSEIQNDKVLCLCVENYEQVYVLDFSSNKMALKFKNESVGPFTNKKIECNFPEEAL